MARSACAIQAFIEDDLETTGSGGRAGRSRTGGLVAVLEAVSGVTRRPSRGFGADARHVETEGSLHVPVAHVQFDATESAGEGGPGIEALHLHLDQVLRRVHELRVQAEAEPVEGAGLGRLDRLSPKLRREIEQAIEMTKDNTGLTLSVAFDYGGRDEIVEATRRIVAEGIPAEQIDETLFVRYLQTPTIPDPDLLIRTGGESRISNFLLWQSAYSEFYSTSVHWPDFDEQEMERALEAFRFRKRRFGSLSLEE